MIKKQRKNTKKIRKTRKTNRNAGGGNQSSVLYELSKGFAGIFLLLCVVGTCAMGVDLYFTNFRPGKIELSNTSDANASGTNISARNTSGNYSISGRDHNIKKEGNGSKQSLSGRQNNEHPRMAEAPLQGLKNKTKALFNASENNSISSVNNKIAFHKPVFEVFDDEPVKKDKPHTPPSGAEAFHPQGPGVAIIIDDIGFDMKAAYAFAALDVNITISILPVAPFAVKIARKLHTQGVKLMLHLPMEPVEYPKVDPGPGAILSIMSPDEVLKTLRMNLEAVPHITGVNNHMGSAITALSPQMHQIFTVLKKRELFFIDSLTSKASLCSQAARLLQVPFGQRDVFLDNIQEKKYIKKQLKRLIAVAIRHGTAIGIGHPYPATLLALKDEMPYLKKKVRIVPASTLAAVLQ